MAHGACSRLEPLPKFCPASSTTAPSCSGLFITKSGSSRQLEKRNWPKPVLSIRLRASLGTIWSVSTSSQPSGSALPSIFLTGSIEITRREPSSLGDGGSRVRLLSDYYLEKRQSAVHLTCEESVQISSLSQQLPNWGS